MPFKKIAAQVAKPGKTVQLVLAALTSPKGSPVLVVEHLGESNAQFWGDQIARAKAQSSMVKTSKKTRDQEFSESTIAAARAANRETLATYSVRGLENVFHDDGTAATNDDIHAFVMSLPDDVIDEVISFVANANYFRDAPIEGDPKTIAVK